MNVGWIMKRRLRAPWLAVLGQGDGERARVELAQIGANLLEGALAAPMPVVQCGRYEANPKENQMTSFESTIEVDRPVREVYDAWTQFEQFPRFMDHVQSVKQIDETHLHWHAKIAGQEHEWDAKILEQQPDRAISWESVSGAENSGAVEFEVIDDSTTRVRLKLNYEPVGVLESTGAALGLMGLSVKKDLSSFKELIEHEADSGHGWRGEVHDGDADSDGNLIRPMNPLPELHIDPSDLARRQDSIFEGDPGLPGQAKATREDF